MFGRKHILPEIIRQRTGKSIYLVYVKSARVAVYEIIYAHHSAQIETTVNFLSGIPYFLFKLALERKFAQGAVLFPSHVFVRKAQYFVLCAGFFKLAYQNFAVGGHCGTVYLVKIRQSLLHQHPVVKGKRRFKRGFKIRLTAADGNTYARTEICRLYYQRKSDEVGHVPSRVFAVRAF